MELYEKNGNILYILTILKKYSDEVHILSIKEIKEKIKEIYEVDIEARTIRRNIHLLKEKFGYDISTFNENKEGYYILRDVDTDFEPGEIKAIINQFSYANYIPQKLAESIIRKCQNMLNVYELEKEKDYQMICKDTKTENIEIIKNLEDIENAIYEKKKIEFTYFKYELSNSLKKVNVNKIKCSPFKVVYNLQQLYLICLKEGASKMYTYRMDRMKEVRILKEKASTRVQQEEVEVYIKESIAMFSGDALDITFRLPLELLDMVVEQFGKDIRLKKVNQNTFEASVRVSHQGFLYFALRNIKDIQIISPLSLKEEVKNILEEYLSKN